MKSSKTPTGPFFVLLLVLIAANGIYAVGGAPEADETPAFASYRQNPETHPNIPNNSYAGYQYGEQPIPDLPVVANAVDFGAKGDGRTESSKAINNAVKAAAAKGGGAVLLPAGTYRISDEIWICHDNVALRGEGSGKTVLKVDKSLEETYTGQDNRGDKSTSAWSFNGGFVWIAPEEEMSATRRYISFEWRKGKGDSVAADTAMGDRKLFLNNAALFSKGQRILIVCGDTPEKTFQRDIFRDLKLACGYSWSEWAKRDKIFAANFNYPVEIEAIEGNTLTLRHPLRLPVRKGYKVTAITSMVRNSGVENLSIVMKGNNNWVHHEEKGYNGIFFNCAWDCWARDIEVRNWEVGVSMVDTKCITVKNVALTGSGRHIGFNNNRASDNLIMNFFLEPKLYHGITFNTFSHGIVYSHGELKHGTIDHHRGLDFDIIITDLTIYNDGEHGGVDAPCFGGRNVHWSVKVTNGRPYMIAPVNLMPYGAVVGCEGCQPYREKEEDYAGNLHTLFEGQGMRVKPENLYQAQVRLRLGYLPDYLI